MSYFIGSMANNFVGGNAEIKSDTIWAIAARHNQKSRELNGHTTVVRRRKVDSIKTVGLR